MISVIGAWWDVRLDAEACRAFFRPHSGHTAISGPTCLIEFRMGERHDTHVRRWFEVGAECVRRDFREYRIDASPDVRLRPLPVTRRHECSMVSDRRGKCGAGERKPAYRGLGRT